MSRIGKQPVPVPEKVKVDISGQTISVEGPKGKLAKTFNSAARSLSVMAKLLSLRLTTRASPMPCMAPLVPSSPAW